MIASIRRLEYLYSFFDVAWRDDDPVYPFTSAHVDAVSQLRTRDCLGEFREFHNACIAVGAIVGTTLPQVAAQAPEPSPAPDRLWHETVAAAATPTEDDQTRAHA